MPASHGKTRRARRKRNATGHNMVTRGRHDRSRSGDASHAGERSARKANTPSNINKFKPLHFVGSPDAPNTAQVESPSTLDDIDLNDSAEIPNEDTRHNARPLGKLSQPGKISPDFKMALDFNTPDDKCIPRTRFVSRRVKGVPRVQNPEFSDSDTEGEEDYEVVSGDHCGGGHGVTGAVKNQELDSTGCPALQSDEFQPTQRLPRNCMQGHDPLRWLFRNTSEHRTPEGSASKVAQCSPRLLNSRPQTGDLPYHDSVQSCQKRVAPHKTIENQENLCHSQGLTNCRMHKPLRIETPKRYGTSSEAVAILAYETPEEDRGLSLRQRITKYWDQL